MRVLSVKSRVRGLLAGCGALMLLIGTAGPVTTAQAADKDSEKPAAAAAYVGKLANAPASARVALIREGNLVLAYVCSRDAAFNEMAARWFRGEADAKGHFHLKSPDGLELLGNPAEGDRIQMTLKAGGTEYMTTAQRLSGKGPAGLYRDEVYTGEGDIIAGWIVDEQGEAAGAVRRPGNKPRIDTPPVSPQVTDVSKLATQVGNANLRPNQIGTLKLPKIKVTSAKLQQGGDDATFGFIVDWTLENTTTSAVTKFTVNLKVTFSDNSTDSSSVTVNANDREAIPRVLRKSGVFLKSFSGNVTGSALTPPATPGNFSGTFPTQ